APLPRLEAHPRRIMTDEARRPSSVGAPGNGHRVARVLRDARPPHHVGRAAWPIGGTYEAGCGLMIPNVAPCGSRRTAMRPTVGTSIGSASTDPPSSFAFAVVASTSSTATYGCQCGGMAASGTAIT